MGGVEYQRSKSYVSTPPRAGEIPDLQQAGSQSPNHIPVASKVLYKKEPEAKRPRIIVQTQRPHWASPLMQPWRCPSSQGLWDRES